MYTFARTHACKRMQALPNPEQSNPSAGRSGTVATVFLAASQPTVFTAFQRGQTWHLRKQFFLSRFESHLSGLPLPFSAVLATTCVTFRFLDFITTLSRSFSRLCPFPAPFLPTDASRSSALSYISRLQKEFPLVYLAIVVEVYSTECSG